MPNTLRLMFLGDIIGTSGQVMFQKWVSKLKKEHKIDALVVNGENTAKNGKGINPKIMEFFKHNGVDVVTSGNHIWHNKEIYNYLNTNNDLLRPANYPSDCPGKGYAVIEVKGYTIGIMNLQGRVFMHDNIDCPFRTAQSLLTLLKTKTNMVFVDFHAEATSEKQALGYYLDGQVSGLFGTHTHVPTADSRILPQGTGYITDLGFCGALNSVIGVEKEAVTQKFLTQMLHRFAVDKRGPFALNGIWLDVDTDTGKTVKIERINVIDDRVETI